MDKLRLKKLLSYQKMILSQIALGVPLNAVLNDICLSIEEIFNSETAKCSILSLSGEQLFHCAGPHIHPGYRQAINGIKIGNNVGSCGTAAFLKKQVIVDDITTSVLWQNFQPLADQYQLKACWSTPIISSAAELLGTIAVYHSEPRVPTHQELELIDFFAHFTSIALEKNSESEKVKRLIANLTQSNNKFAAFTKVMPDLSLILSEEGEYIDIYGSSNDMLYRSVNEMLNQKVTDMLPSQDAEAVMSVIAKTLSTNDVQIFEYDLEIQGRFMTFEGRTACIDNYLAEDPQKKHIVWVARDITVRKKTEQEINRLAFFDPLTSLPNRRMLSDRLNMYVDVVKATTKTGALFFLDLDNFKRINDSLGHGAGDEILIEVASRLSNTIRNIDTLARVGGDEFVLLLECIGDGDEQAVIEAEHVANKLQNAFNDEFKLGELVFKVNCSIGICLIDENNSDPENILKYADTAMYRSKMNGGNRSHFYDPALQSLLDSQTEIESDIVRAIAANEFCAYFQPQVDKAAKVIGAEALIRWIHPTKGLISPNEFIPIAEQYGLLQSLQNIVLRDICSLLQVLNEKQVIDDTFKISINISHGQFSSATLPHTLFNTINEFNISASQIKLEITETMLSVDNASTVQQMDELQQLGFTFSIDDFGTGYSCLAHLSTFPVDELKVDKSFIDKILDKGAGFSILQTIINLGKSLNLAVVAEGAETQEQFELLQSVDITAVQGFYIAKPMSHSNYLTWHLGQ
ncbi:EAL domain-containing protein [Pseudoalteromonas sp. MMG010]|uniref:sensor domain-containing phosphodiesterase n=1 Tax=Pseudoalteromonas sp. MMG010 TaxID=2822685 RepID=UPI001B3A1AFD|nr:EAL domain-containing protein [Pseudoalteromonas sp. MMG010]MBQ4834539.1 EAL domain-containing protein [Pseudoalteromonas sp. MMG010]